MVCSHGIDHSDFFLALLTRSNWRALSVLGYGLLQLPLFGETNRVCHSCFKAYNGYCVHAKHDKVLFYHNAIEPGNNDVIAARFISQIVMNWFLSYKNNDKNIDNLRLKERKFIFSDFNFLQPFVLGEKKLLRYYQAAVRSKRNSMLRDHLKVNIHQQWNGFIWMLEAIKKSR